MQLVVTVLILLLIGLEDGIIYTVMRTHLKPDVDDIGYDEEDRGYAGHREDIALQDIISDIRIVAKSRVKGSWDSKAESTVESS